MNKLLAVLLLLVSVAGAQEKEDPFVWGSEFGSGQSGGGIAPEGPALSGVSATMIPVRNGDPMDIEVSATADESSIWEITIIYTSTWFDARYDPGTKYPNTAGGNDITYHLWKTAAAGSKVYDPGSPSLSFTDYACEVGPRVYHTDIVTVNVRAQSVATGNWSTTSIAINEVAIDMPFDAPATITGSETGPVISHIGSQWPTQYGLGTIAQYAEGQGVFFSGSFLDEGPWTPVGEDHFVDRVRAEGGSANKWVMGFLDNNVIYDTTYPIECVWWALLDEQVKGSNPDYVVRDINGDHPHPNSKQYMLNYGNPDAVDFAVDYYMTRINHSENREPNTGLCWDVAELTHYMPLINPSTGLQDRYGHVADCDQDGVVHELDFLEQQDYFLGQISFFSKMRTAIEDSDTETDVGDYYIIGANSQSARLWPALAAELDFIFLEGMSLPVAVGNEFVEYNGLWYDETDNAREIWKWAFSTSFTHYRPTSHYLSIAYTEFIGYPDQTMSQAFEDLDGYMDQAGSPPIRMLENQSGHLRTINDDCDDGSTPEVSDPVHVHPEQLEVISLLFDNMSAVWHKYSYTSWPRQPWSPVREGYTSLAGLGFPSEDIQRDGDGYYSRTYSNGEVQVWIEEGLWDHYGEYTVCAPVLAAAGEETWLTTWPTQPQWQVTITGTGVVRESVDWEAPGGGPDTTPPVPAIANADYDELGTGGKVRLVFDGSADEESYFRVSYRRNDGARVYGAWSASTADADSTISYIVDTGVTPVLDDTYDILLAAKDTEGNLADADSVRVTLTSGGAGDTVYLYLSNNSTGYDNTGFAASYAAATDGQSAEAFGGAFARFDRDTPTVVYDRGDLDWRLTWSSGGMPVDTVSQPFLWYFGVTDVLGVSDTVTEAKLFFYNIDAETAGSLDTLHVIGLSLTGLDGWHASFDDASWDYEFQSTTTVWDPLLTTLTDFNSFNDGGVGKWTDACISDWTAATWIEIDVTDQVKQWQEDGDPECGLWGHAWGDNSGSWDCGSPQSSSSGLPTSPYLYLEVVK